MSGEVVGWKVSEVRREKEEGKGENQGTSGKGKNKVLQQSNRLEEAAPETRKKRSVGGRERVWEEEMEGRIKKEREGVEHTLHLIELQPGPQSVLVQAQFWYLTWSRGTRRIHISEMHVY